MKHGMIPMAATVLISCLLTATVGYGAAYYVDVESRGGRADDANPGTLARPWKTIGRAFDGRKRPCASAGHTVWIRGGTYRETLRVTRGGEPDRPLVIKAFGGEKPVIDGESKRANGLILPEDSNADHVVIEGLTD